MIGSSGLACGRCRDIEFIPTVRWFHRKLIAHMRMIIIVFRLEWASLFDTEKLLGKQVMIVILIVVTMVVVVMLKRMLLKLAKVSWEALREALAVLERPSTVMIVMVMVVMAVTMLVVMMALVVVVTMMVVVETEQGVLGSLEGGAGGAGEAKHS